MPVEAQLFLAHPAHQVHPGPQASQDMEDQDLKETKETQAFHPTLDRIILDHQDHLALLGLKDQQVLQDQGDTKVNKASQVCREVQEDQEPLRQGRLMVEYAGSLDHQVHQDLLDFKDHLDTKGTLELLGFQALQEADQSLVLLVPQVLLALLACQAPSLLPVTYGSTLLNI